MTTTARADTRDTRAWQQADSAHFLHPFTDHASLAGKGARVIERGEGIHVWDTDGNRILDAMSGLWCVNVGYGQRALIDAATRQLERLPFYNAFFNTTTPPAIELAELLADVAPPSFRHVFFTSSGSEGNDTVVRMVRRYWDVLGQPQRKVIIGRWNGYHGSTMAGASLGGMAGMHAQGGLPIPDIVHVQQPFWFELGRDQSPEDFGLAAARTLEAKILELGPDKVAAFIGEPIQGAGGVIVPPSTYWPEVQRICDRHGILLVSDEVICGFGRTGRWFGCETFGFKPDLMTFAKGVTSGYVPLGGVMVGDRVADVLIERGGEFNHGYTYSGHPVACAVAVANLKLIRDLVDGAVPGGAVRRATGGTVGLHAAIVADARRWRAPGYLDRHGVRRVPARPGRQHPAGAAGEVPRPRARHGGAAGAGEGRVPQPGWLGEGPDRRADDRGGRGVG